MIKVIIKRLFDFVVSLIGLVIISPILMIFAIRIKLDSKGPVFYRGQRIGLYGKQFRIYKFRSMVEKAEKIGPSSTSGDDPRITNVGSFMRRFKIDELPQIINVLIGEMSFVGPRPEVQKFVDQYTEEEKAILTVRPGITDWSSLQFPNEDEILDLHKDEYPDADEAYAIYIRPEKLRLQLKYVHNNNIVIDIIIICKTILAVVSKVQ
ncbi:MAG: sugar transferase [Candidatus Electryonea clarkiae]|nr:sugar transferase [Candidatus Electryonea clarkiae]MDP8285849.1 sugar transferase [Candidatus Electryonea clarkiae]